MKTATAIFLLLLIFHPTHSEKKVACIGNSITEGNMGGKYPPKLQVLLGSDYTVENDGISGTTMLKKGDKPYWTQGRLGQVFAFKPDIITIKLGTNDTKSQNWDSHGDEFKQDYLAMIDTLYTLSSKPKLFLVLPAPVFSETYGIRNSIIIKIVDIVHEIGEERELEIIDCNTPLLQFQSYFPDGVHPNDAGADTIAHVIARAILETTGTATGPVNWVAVPRAGGAPVFTRIESCISRQPPAGLRFNLLGRQAPSPTKPVMPAPGIMILQRLSP